MCTGKEGLSWPLLDDDTFCSLYFSLGMTKLYTTTVHSFYPVLFRLICRGADTRGF